MQWGFPSAHEPWSASSLAKIDPSALLPDGVIPTSECANLAIDSYLLLRSQHRQQLVPAGSASDAVKLFVGNLPKCYNEDVLLPIFERFGRVTELMVVRACRPPCAVPAHAARR